MNLKKVFDVANDRPRFFIRWANRLCHTRLNSRPYNPRGTSIFDHDWDNLVILDACRYDIFAEEVDLPGTLSPRQTLGTGTPQFVAGNFTDRTLTDTVYIASNSWFTRMRPELNTDLHAHYDLHRRKQNRAEDTDFSILLPDEVTEQALEIASEYPEKRILVHYVQPHYPYVGPFGRKQFDASKWPSLREAVKGIGRDDIRENVRRAYRENLNQVIPAVQELLNALPGKSVITADHGELLGERHDFIPMRDYGHYRRTYHEKLTTVPWHVVNDGPRKQITSEQPVESSHSEDTEAVNERLRNLGYRV